jgi:hypothetical protein
MQIIPLIDIRDRTPGMLLEGHIAEARALLEASRRSFGPLVHAASYPAAYLGDRLARRWLEKTRNPYLAEIEGFARTLGVPGIYALNLVYEFGCTGGVYATDHGPRLLRVLDWPFLGLGKHTIVAHQRGSGGDFHNVTWPGTSGVFSAMARGRFAAALNQAPMRRHKGGMLRDWFSNRLHAGRATGLPPAHLLRKTCEEAPDYAAAKAMLMREPVSIPVIYILSGTQPGEGCVIERLEEAAAVRELGKGASVSAANHFISHINGIGHGWRPREIDSASRAAQAETIKPLQAFDPDMSWFTYPIANHNSRLCMSAGAAEGTMLLAGTQGAQRVTELFRL